MEPMVLVSYKPIVLVGCIALVMHVLRAGQERVTLPCMEKPMTTLDFITALLGPSGMAFSLAPTLFLQISLSRFMVYCVSNKRRHHAWPVYGSPTCRSAPRS